MYEMDEQSLELEPEGEKEEENLMMSRLEKFDRDYMQKLLRKEGWEYEDNTYYDAQEIPMSAGNLDFSADEKLSAMMRRTNNRGDLSPTRNSIMHRRNIPKELSKNAAGQLSLRENISKRFGKEDSFITPNKGADRYSINFARNREMASVMQMNLLHVAMTQDDCIDYSASRRKSMRIFSQRKSKHDSKSDLSNPVALEEAKSRKRIGSSMSPQSVVNNQLGGKISMKCN